MSKSYKATFKMTGGTVIKSRKFVTPSAILYCMSQPLPADTAIVNIEVFDGKTIDIVNYETEDAVFPTSKMSELENFLEDSKEGSKCVQIN